MYINEAIGRADALMDNEYSQEEKYHWCDVVGAELRSSCQKKFECAQLEREEDNTFLLPENCGFESIERVIAGLNKAVLRKQDLRLYGMREIIRGGRCFLRAERNPGSVSVIYHLPYKPIRRFCLKNVSVRADNADENGNISGMSFDGDIPVIGGDTVFISDGDTKRTVHILSRECRLENDKLICHAECGTGALNDFAKASDGSFSADIERCVTDKTLCGAPFDEMYVDYICAQIAFYQRKFDVYQQCVSRYNTRFSEYAKQLKEYAPENDFSVFTGWQNL